MPSHAQQRLIDYAALPSAEIIWKRTPARVRIKPGESVIASYADNTWMMVGKSRSKQEKILKRAREYGEQLNTQTLGSVYLTEGTWRSDPGLAKYIARAELKDPQLLSYNVKRHVVLRDGDEVLRITDREQKPIAELTSALISAQIPTLPARALKTTLYNPWWESKELSFEEDCSELGRIIARMHSLRVQHPMARIGSMIPEAADMILDLIPESAALYDRAARFLRQNLYMPRYGIVHGDLKPEQVLVSGTQMRLVDLDRAGFGPRGVDLGAWLSQCMIHGRRPDDFLEGYSSVAALPEEKTLRAWTVRALIASAPDPIRRNAGDWPHELERRSRMIEELL